MTWLTRYLAGEREQVWSEMRAAGEALRDDRLGLAAAADVVRATMERARFNVEVLVAELRARGYQFVDPSGRPPFDPPSSDVGDHLDRLEARVGLLPLSLRGWLEHVGRVNLAGSFPSWEYDYTDPLVVDCPLDFIHAERDEWELERGTERDRGAFVIVIAPDWLHKADVSGGAPYTISLPDAAADAPLLDEPHNLTFVEYLRLAFSWGGFPGWDGVRGTDGAWAAPPSTLPLLIDELRERMLAV